MPQLNSDGRKFAPWRRSLSQAERDRMFHGGGERADSAITEAVLSAPRELFGVSESNLNLMKDRFLKAAFSDELDDLTDLEKAIAVTERAATVNLNEIIRQVGITQQRFSELTQPVLREVDAADRAAVNSARTTKDRTIDAHAMAKHIKTLGYDERSKLIDLAIDTNGQHLIGKGAPIRVNGTDTP
jgi:hypothetical protein